MGRNESLSVVRSLVPWRQNTPFRRLPRDHPECAANIKCFALGPVHLITCVSVWLFFPSKATYLCVSKRKHAALATLPHEESPALLPFYLARRANIKNIEKVSTSTLNTLVPRRYHNHRTLQYWNKGLALTMKELTKYRLTLEVLSYVIPAIRTAFGTHVQNTDAHGIFVIRLWTVKVGHFLSRYILVFSVDMPINHLVRQALSSYFIRHALQSLFVLPFFP